MAVRLLGCLIVALCWGASAHAQIGHSGVLGLAPVVPNVTAGNTLTLESQNVSPRCVANGVVDCLPAFNAARDSFSYTTNGFTTSGGLIQLGAGSYYFSDSMDMTAKHGLAVAGVGMLATTVTTNNGNYPLFIDLGSYNAPTNKLIIKDVNVNCGGKSNANAYGIQWKYTNTGQIRNNLFFGCKHGIDGTGLWQVAIDSNRWDGTGSQQNETCLYMHWPTDPNDAFGNNVVIARFNVCQNISLYGARLETATGSIFYGNQWLQGVNGVYLCDPPVGLSNYSYFCEFTFFINDQTDTSSGESWILKRGLAASLGPGILLDHPWAGSGVGAAFDVQNANHIQINHAEIETNDIGFKITDSNNSIFTGKAYNTNVHNDGSAAALLTGTTFNNVVKLEPIPQPAHPLPGYNGIVETGSFTANQLWAGQASCGIGLAFGGASTGITYTSGPATTNECQYEVKGLSVRVQFLMTLSNVGSATGAATLTGLPITAGPAVGWGFGGVSTLQAQANFSGLTGSVIASVVPAGTTAGLVQQGATGTANVTDSNFTNTSNLAGMLEYFKN